jgi:hypothetical protein
MILAHGTRPRGRTGTGCAAWTAPRPCASAGPVEPLAWRRAAGPEVPGKPRYQANPDAVTYHGSPDPRTGPQVQRRPWPTLAVQLLTARGTDGYETVWFYQRLSAACAKHKR